MRVQDGIDGAIEAKDAFARFRALDWNRGGYFDAVFFE